MDYELKVSLYICDIDNFLPSLNYIQKIALNSYEKKRFLQIKNLAVQNRFIITRYLIKAILSNKLQKDFKTIQLLTDKNGKPYIENFPPVSFNISHSGNYIAFAVVDSSSLIGIDIENNSQKRPFLGMAQRFFSIKEFETLKKYQHDIDFLREAFYHVWTQKEAFIKAVGYGIQYDLKSFDVEVNPRFPAKIYELRQEQDAKKNWSIFSSNEIVNYNLALVVECSNIHLDIFALELKRSDVKGSFENDLIITKFSKSR